MIVELSVLQSITPMLFVRVMFVINEANPNITVQCREDITFQIRGGVQNDFPIHTRNSVDMFGHERDVM